MLYSHNRTQLGHDRRCEASDIVKFSFKRHVIAAVAMRLVRFGQLTIIIYRAPLRRATARPWPLEPPSGSLFPAPAIADLQPEPPQRHDSARIAVKARNYRLACWEQYGWRRKQGPYKRPWLSPPYCSLAAQGAVGPGSSQCAVGPGSSNGPGAAPRLLTKR